MNNQILLGEHLFSATTGQIDSGQLENIVAEHPYSAIAQFYLLHTKRIDGKTDINAQAGKTALFFNNTHWLNWQLHQMDSTIKSWKDETLKDDSIKEPFVNAKLNPKEALIPFEPLHAIDYFASQGITITGEANTTDKLGKQLKSFTEWLKTMKKIHTEKLDPGSEYSDNKIQTIAEGSNTNADVVTEAMADVLEKQGKVEKAIETYQKLSLIDPAKNAYFAAKIDSLKGS